MSRLLARRGNYCQARLDHGGNLFSRLPCLPKEANGLPQRHEERSKTSRVRRRWKLSMRTS
jgi:hypothetical protein